MQKPLHVLISGAGLAGPALAIALAKQSIRSTILERRPKSTDIGGVIMLAPNAMRVMDSLLGIGQQLRDVGDTFKAINIYTKGSNTLDKVGGFIVEDDGILGLTIARPELHRQLLQECERMKDMITLRYGAEVDSIREDEDGCEAVLKGGEVVRGSILVGADGIRSPTRRHILGSQDVSPRYAGYVSIGCILPRSQASLPPDMPLPAFLYTPSGTFLIFAMDNDNDKIQWATSVTMDERERHGWEEFRTSGQALEIIKEEYKGVNAEPIRSLVASLSQDNLRLWAPYEVPPIPSWHTDRIVLVGDAAHAISPAVGQGSAQAFEDIGLLARLLSSPAIVDQGFPALFARYEKTRRPRVQTIQKASARAESSRGKTGFLMWTVRSWAIWLGLKLFGKDGYVKGDLFRYNVMEENIEVK